MDNNQDRQHNHLFRNTVAGPNNMVFITFYDMICYGTRLLSAVAKENGFIPHLILVKDEQSHVPIWKDLDRFESYQYFYNGLKRGSLYAVDPITEREKKLLIRLVVDLKPSVICISTRTFAYEICKEIIPNIKALLPDVPVLSGGWGPSLEPEKFLEFSDFVFFGEGEKSFSDICSRIAAGEDILTVLRTANNIIYYKDEQMVRNQVSEPLTVKEMDMVPFPDFERKNKYLIAHNKVQPGEVFYNEKIYDCFAGRGCPMNCSYCMSSKYQELYRDEYGIRCPKWRLRSVDRVIEEVKAGKERGATVIRFKDEVFPPSPSWVKEFIPKYKKEVGLPFFAYLRPEYHPPELIDEIIKAGCYITIVGVQSGADEIRKNVYFRNLQKDKIVAFAEQLKDKKLDFLYHFIYRNPFEKEAHMQETLELIRRLPYAQICVYKLQRFPKSPIGMMLDEQKPAGEDIKTNHWYAILYTMAAKGASYRKLSRFIQDHNLFRSCPMALSLTFAPELLKEWKTYLVNRLVYNAKARLLPKRT